MLKSCLSLFAAALVNMVFFLPGVLADPPRSPAATAWVLPLTLNDDNTDVQYTYRLLGRDDSGRSRGVRGKVWLENLDLRSIKAQMNIPAPSIAGLASNAFGPLAELLKNTQLPAVNISIDRFDRLCLPQDILPGKACTANMRGRAQIGPISHALDLPVRIERKQENFVVKGEGEVDTAAAARSAAIGSMLEAATFAFTITIPG